MNNRLAFLALLGTISLAACGTGDVRDRSRASGDPPAAASSISAQRLDPEKVPADLRHLTPVAERWGIGDDVDRNVKVDAATAAEREELQTAVEPYGARITEWLNSFGQTVMPDEPAAFMYMQLALEEMRAGGAR